MNDVFGTLNPPTGVAEYNATAGGIGIILFASNMIRLATVVAGIWVLFNIISAGFIYISSSGNAQAHQQVRDKITMSVLGLIVIVSAFLIAGLLGLIFFGNAAYFLNPVLFGPGSTP